MNTLKRLFLPAVAAVLCFCMGCETNELLKLVPLEPADISVEKLIQRLTEATDPQMEYHNCKSYLMKQELSVVKAGVKDVMATEVRFQAPDKMRITTFKENRPSFVEIYNGGKAWKVDCSTGKVNRVPDGMPIQLMTLFVKMGTPSLDLNEIFKNVTIEMDIRENPKVYRLICDAGIEGIAPYVYYIDSRTNLIQRFETVMYAQGEEYLYVNIPADYTRYEKDILIPATSTVTLMDTVNISRLKEFKINPVFPESDFLPPVPFSHQKKTLRDAFKNKKQDKK